MPACNVLCFTVFELNHVCKVSVSDYLPSERTYLRDSTCDHRRVC